jgi:hypothetical protein
MHATASLDRPRRDSDVPAAAVLLFLIVPLAAWLYGDFVGSAHLLWRDLDHDRNGHFQFGLNMALDLARGDVAAFVSDLNRATVWPPLHGLVLALVLLVGGIDMRLAVLPSLAGWVVTVVATALVARRLVGQRTEGNVAAAVALIFVAASPSLRDYALDSMLESLGAALTAVALYLYLRAKAEPAERWPAGRWWRGFALVLTLLFFEKANYWGLLIGGIVVAEVAADPAAALAAVRTIAARLGTRAFWAAQARAPLTWVFIALVAVVVTISLRGPTAIMLFGRRVSFYPPENLTTAAFWAVFLRALQLWRASPASRAQPQAHPSPLRTLLAWHGLPVAVWFLLPHKLSTFLWYAGPANGPTGSFDPFAGVMRYVDWAAHEYHATPAAAAAALALAAVALARLRRLAPGGGAVAAVLAVSLLGASVHPNQKARFLESWVPTLWMLAGAGGGVITAALPAALGRWRHAIAAAGLIALGWWHVPALTRSWQATPWAGPADASDLDVAALYLDRLPADRPAALVSTIGGQAFFGWSYAVRFGDRRRLDLFTIFEPTNRARLRADAASWASATPADVAVVVDATDARLDDPAAGMVSSELAAIFAEALRSDGRFVAGEQRTLPGTGMRVTLWTRATP